VHEQFAPQLQHEQEIVKRNHNNVTPSNKRLVSLIESLAHRALLEKVREEVKLHIETILNGNLTTNANNTPTTIPYTIRESMAHFTTLRMHLCKYDLLNLVSRTGPPIWLPIL